MTWEAHVETRDVLTRDLRVWLVQPRQDGSLDVLGPDGDTVTRYEPGTAPDPDAQPTIRLPRDSGAALLAALQRHFGVVESPGQLRKDFEHERGRVDLLIGHLMTLDHHVITGGTP